MEKINKKIINRLLLIGILAFVTSGFSACNLPTSLEELIHWSELFFLTPEQDGLVQSMLISMSTVLIGVSAMLALAGFAYNLATGKKLAGGLYTTGMILMMISYSVTLYIPLASNLGKLALGEISIDEVFSTYGWGLTINPTEIGMMGTAIGLTIALPKIVAMYEVVMVILLIIGIWGSIVDGSLSGAVFSVAQLIFFLLFLWLYRFLVTASTLVTSIPFVGAITEPVMNAFYIGAVITLMVLCFWYLPRTASKRIDRLVTVRLDGSKLTVHRNQSTNPSAPQKITRRTKLHSTIKRTVKRTGEVASAAAAVQKQGSQTVKRRNS